MDQGKYVAIILAVKKLIATYIINVRRFPDDYFVYELTHFLSGVVFLLGKIRTVGRGSRTHLATRLGERSWFYAESQKKYSDFEQLNPVRLQFVALIFCLLNQKKAYLFCKIPDIDKTGIEFKISIVEIFSINKEQ